MPALTEDSLRQLPPFQNRKYIPVDAQLSQLDVVTKLYQDLINKEIHSARDLEHWVWHRTELEAALSQEGSILYIEMTCQTDDPKRAASYSQFIQTIIPAVKPLEDKLNHRFLAEAKKFPLDEKLFGLYVHRVKSDVELFIESNVPLQTQVELLSQEYQSISGAMTVQFQGKEMTLPQMSKFLLEPDRALRESAWKVVAERRLKDKEKLDELFDKMLSLRNMIARNAKCENFEDYQFKAYHRFDYTKKNCEEFHQVIEKCVLPLWKEILKERKRLMKVDSLRPWDTAVDPQGLPALKPFRETDELIKGCQKIFSKVNEDFGKQFSAMMDLGLLDLTNRKGKAPGGYQQSLSEARKPFIFMNAIGVDDDVRTLLHEGGHAFHSLSCSTQPILDYRHGPMEFNEVSSMGMELLGGEFMKEFYNSADDKRSRKEHFEGIIYTLVWVATIDCFQQWIYEHPDQSREERNKAWLSIRKRFGDGFVSWEGLEEEQTYLWHRQLHIFEVPFYYIEYGFAQLGALQLWFNAKKDWDKAITDLKKGFALGGSRSLPEIYQAAGIQFKFTQDVVGPIVQKINDEWKSL